jgi:HD-GYP domain-containing protein (c-di-GMP phosphodiesterase class II)
MRLKTEIHGSNGDDAAALLSQRLSEAVQAERRNRTNADSAAGGTSVGRGWAGSAISKERARRIASDVGAAMLAATSAGTAQHSDDVVLIAEAIGEKVGVAGEDAADLLTAARLHDVGKTWIPGDLLEKPGPLSEEDWALMRRHTIVGEQILSSVVELREVGRLVRHSHERWDGTGYPDGLAGEEIPLGSRIIFVADAFHAIRCDRAYRAGRSAQEAVTEILRCAGTQFDPRVAEMLEEVVRERDRPVRGVPRSTRLLALFMCLVVGGAGSAVARSGLLGEPSASAAGTAPSVQPTPQGLPLIAGLVPVGPGGGIGAQVSALAHAAKGTHGNGKGKHGSQGKDGKGKGKHGNKGKHNGQGKSNNGRSEHAGGSGSQGSSVSASHAPASTSGGGGSSHSSGGHSSQSHGAGGSSGGHSSGAHGH